ncbi:MAG TPA: lasso peptide biosynthesis B2 protein [Allosphingosinicella sp.]
MAAPITKSRLPRLGPSDWLMLAEALAALTLASLAIAVLPFRRVAAAASAPVRSAAPADARIIRRVRSAVRAWSRRVPWKTVCFQRGLALHWMLRRRGIGSVLLYGARREGDGLAAHVWVDVEGETVIGGEEAPSFACLARFPPDAA